MVLGEKEKPIYRPGFIKRQIMRLYVPYFSKIVLSGESCTDGILYNTAMDYAELTGKRDGDRCVLRNRYNWSDCGQECKESHWVES